MELEKHIANELEWISNWPGKVFGQIMRIVALLHIATYAKNSVQIEVDEVILECAFKIGDYLIDHAKTTYGATGGSKTAITAEKTLNFIRKSVMKSGKHELTRSAVNRYWNGSISKTQLEESLELLEDCGFIRQIEERKDGRGRPSMKRIFCGNNS